MKWNFNDADSLILSIYFQLVKLLLRYGAKLTSKTDKGDTPVEVASSVVLNYLENHGLIPECKYGILLSLQSRLKENRMINFDKQSVKSGKTTSAISFAYLWSK